MRRGVRMIAPPLAALALLVLGADPARAELVFTRQAVAANALDSAWAPVPERPPALCIVDTGVDPNPDTANVVERLAIDGGDPGDVDPGHHGTRMAMIAAAPYNGFGMVGAAPGIRVVSVRVARPGGRSIEARHLVDGAMQCLLRRHVLNIKVVSFSAGAPGPLDPELGSQLDNLAVRARDGDVSLVAAAGNSGFVEYPAAHYGFLAVGAVDGGGNRCSFSPSSPMVGLSASGCPQDVAMPDGSPALSGGTSEAAVFTAAVLTQLRGLRPDLDARSAEALLINSARPGADGPLLDVAAAFRAAGLEWALNAGRARRPDATPGVAPVSQTPGNTTSPAQERPGSSIPQAVLASSRPERLPKPQVRSVRRSAARLSFLLANRPKGMRAHVDLYARKAGRAFPALVRRLKVNQRRVRFRVPRGLTQVIVRYVDPRGRRPPSTSVVVRAGRS